MDRTPRRLLSAAIVLVLSLTAWCAGASLYFFTPDDTSEPTSEVLYVLGAGRDRVAAGLEALDEGRADVLVLSAARANTPVCLAGSYQGRPVLCPQPDPMTTQGEAIQLSELSAEHGWTDITVVTHRAHMRRTRILMERCTEQPLRYQIEANQWGPRILFSQLVYETGAMVKTLITPGCRQTL